jgi:hypothetical protein
VRDRTSGTPSASFTFEMTRNCDAGSFWSSAIASEKFRRTDVVVVDLVRALFAAEQEVAHRRGYGA